MSVFKHRPVRDQYGWAVAPSSSRQGADYGVALRAAMMLHAYTLDELAQKESDALAAWKAAKRVHYMARMRMRNMRRQLVRHEPASSGGPTPKEEN